MDSTPLPVSFFPELTVVIIYSIDFSVLMNRVCTRHFIFLNASVILLDSVILDIVYIDLLSAETDLPIFLRFWDSVKMLEKN